MLTTRSAPTLIALLALAAPALAQTRVVLVGIDQATQRELGPFGGSYRAHHATLIKRLNQARAKGIAFDVFFPPNPEQVEGTRRLADAAARSVAGGVPVVIAVGAPPESKGKEPKLIPNDPIFQGRGIGEGAIVLVRERSGVMSRGGLATLRTVGGYRPLAEELALRTGVLAEGELERLGLVEEVPTGASLFGGTVTQAALRPGFSDTPPGSVTTVSYVDVLNGRVGREVLEGALVLVGLNDGHLDMISDPDPSGSPALKSLPGVFAHVALLQRVAQAAEAKSQAQAPAKRPRTRGLLGALGTR